MDRREFVKAVSGMTVLGGGLLLGGVAGGEAERLAEPGARWPNLGRPPVPRRLSDVTHDLARRALSGEHGRTMRRADFDYDRARLVGLSPDLRYAEAACIVAEKAPLRILPHEKIVGAATLIEAAAHATPVAGGSSVSHTTLGFDRVLQEGYRGLRERIARRLARGDFPAPAPFALVQGPGGQALPTCPGCSYWAEAVHRPEYETPPFTVECRARVHGRDRFNVLVANRSKESRHHWEIYSYAHSGVFSAYLPGYAPAEIKSDRDITDGHWHDLAMTFDGTRVRLYVDGEQVADRQVQASGALGDGVAALFLGGYPPQGIGCHGAVERVRISRGLRSIIATPGDLDADADTLSLWRPVSDDRGVAFEDSGALGNPATVALPRRGADLLHAMNRCLDAATIWHGRYIEELGRRIAASEGVEREEYEAVREALRRVPEAPPQSFREALQALWFAYAFQRLMGTWSGLGRLDEMLGPFLQRDLEAGAITLDEARELLAHFWIKGCEWIGAFETRGSGDAQHYQNVVLAGVDAHGREVAGEVTYLILDVVEELHISDFPIAVRLNRNSPTRLLRRVAEVQRHGGGIVAVYNEDVVIEGLVKFGYAVEVARRFANDGCWEVIIPGETVFGYVPFDMLAVLHGTLGLHTPEAPAPDFADFEALYAEFTRRVAEALDRHQRAADGWAQGGIPTPLVSLLVHDCIETCRGYYDRGPRYRVLAPHAGGMPNVADSLLAVRRLVYEEGRMSLPALVEALRADWEGHEGLRQMIVRRVPAYGNDDPAADGMMERLFADYTDLAWVVREREGVLRPAGISTFGREIEWSKAGAGRRASPDGHRMGAVLATNLSPSPAKDREGPTAALKSYCKMDFTRTPNGATLELKVHPASVKGDAGLAAMVGLMRAFVDLGGMFLHVDVVDSAMLRDAQAHPERYPNLSVRIAGWSARFATLDRDWQDMVIQRTQQMMAG